MDLVLCEVSTSNSFENEEQLKKDDNQDDNHVLKHEHTSIMVGDRVCDNTKEDT